MRSLFEKNIHVIILIHRKSVSRAWGRQCYLSNKLFFDASCHVVSVCKILLSLTSDVTTFAESVVYILYIFANNFGTERDYYGKGPIGLLFHVFSHETINFSIANVLQMCLCVSDLLFMI